MPQSEKQNKCTHAINSTGSANGCTRLRTIGRTPIPWALVFACMVCFIWGNSLVPGTESGSISMGVVEMVKGALTGLGLGSDWVTNFVVRKTAHFTEYLVLGLIGMQTLAPHRPPRTVARALATAALLAAVPSIDETIQLFVSDRSGQVTDVLIDCSGAATGALLTCLVSWLRSRMGRGSQN